MTPLSDALTAAQKRALQALEKAYVAGAIEPDALREKLHGCGISDDVDISYLVHALNVLREWGAPLPVETNGTPKRENMTASQRGFIEQLCREKNLPEPETFDDLSKAQASEAINALQAGDYDPARWRVPF